jgi:hypothetical protein
MKKMFGMVAVAALVLTGCGNTCDDLDDAVTAFNKKAAPCNDNSDVLTFNMNQCTNNIDKCSSDDKKAIGDFADCLRDLPTCSSSNENSFNAGFLTCASALNEKISDTCSSAFSD